MQSKNRITGEGWIDQARLPSKVVGNIYVAEEYCTVFVNFLKIFKRMVSIDKADIQSGMSHDVEKCSRYKVNRASSLAIELREKS
jgi:hypothetical protein